MKCPNCGGEELIHYEVKPARPHRKNQGVACDQGCTEYGMLCRGCRVFRPYAATMTVE